MAGRRLDQVDAIRPVKQAGVISTHVLLNFAPASAAAGAGAALTLLHVSREGFFFISACMLTYAYADLKVGGLRRFYWRRFVSVAIPYACWTVIYFCFLLHTTHYASLAAALKSLASMAATGYYQLYFLLVIMQFYVVFPVIVALLRRTRGHHGLVVAAAAALQVAVTVIIHWQIVPLGLFRNSAPQSATSYALYLIGGCVVAFHLEDVHRWVCRNARLVVGLTVLAALAAECVYYLAQEHVVRALGVGDDPFQPSVIPFNVGAIACAYLAGVALVRAGRSPRTRAAVRSGSDNAYGIYLTQMLFITTLSWLGWERLTSTVPWPLLCLLTVACVYLGCIALTSLLARTPLAVPLTGRKQQPLATLLPRRWRPGARDTRSPGSGRQASGFHALPSSADLPPAKPATLAGASDPNGG
jgi:peptidoglycan/LPS O-acetylase OafA/YrhL